MAPRIVSDQHVSRRKRLGYHAVWGAQHLLGLGPGGSAIERLLDGPKRAVQQDIVDDLKASPEVTDVGEPDRVRGMDPREFLERYVKPGRPAILDGLADDWDCCTKWSPEYFAREYGDYPLIVTTDDHKDRGGMVTELPMREYVAGIARGDLRYARVQKILHDRPELMGHMDVPHLMRHKRRIDRVVASQFFFGPKTSTTYIHCAFVNNLFVQAYGHKQWVLWTPEYTPVFMPPVDRTPTFRADADFAIPRDDGVFPHLKRWRFTLKPGDVLFNPSFHWHHVSAETTSISISFRVWSLPSALQSSPMLSAITALATRPPAFAGVLAMRRGGNFLNFYA